MKRLKILTLLNPLCSCFLHTDKYGAIHDKPNTHHSSRRTSCHTRRAIASVVTSAILLSAVSIMGAMLLAWSNTHLASQQQELEEVFSTKMNKINEDVSFSNVWFATPSGGMTENHLNVTISNVGILGLNVTTIRVVNTTASNYAISDYDYTNLGIVPYGSKSANVTYAWQSGDELDIVVFTGRGNQFITQEVAP